MTSSPVQRKERMRCVEELLQMARHSEASAKRMNNNPAMLADAASFRSAAQILGSEMLRFRHSQERPKE